MDFPMSLDKKQKKESINPMDGFQWFVGGWEMFKQQPLQWIFLTIALICTFAILSIIPFVAFLANFLMPIFSAGIFIASKKQEESNILKISDLYGGFQHKTGSLIVIGLIFLGGILALSLLIGIIISIFGSYNIFSNKSAEGVEIVDMIFTYGMVFVFGILILVPLSMSIWYAPALILFHNMKPMEAVIDSFKITLKNWAPLTLYGFIFIVLAIPATIFLGLGWIILLPIVYASMYTSYKGMWKHKIMEQKAIDAAQQL